MRTTLTTTLRSAARKSVMAFSVMAVLGCVAAAPAFADEHDWHRGGHERSERQEHWRNYERRAHEARDDRPYAYAAPRYAYAPPRVAYGAPALNFVFPLDIR